MVSPRSYALERNGTSLPDSRIQGFEEEVDIWEPIEHLSDPDVINLVVSFHREFPRKPVHRTLEDKL